VIVVRPAAPVAIGLPVRNGMPYLAEALASLQAQTYANLVIHVSDNASDDETEAYCRAVAAADPRVVYRRLDSDVGAARNFNEVFQRTQGEYFSWAAHDDRFHPEYVARCVAALERSPEHAMVVPWIRFIDEQGAPGEVLREGPALGSADVAERVRAFLDRHEWFMLYGLARRRVLEQTDLFPRAFGADVILLWELLLRHRIGVVPEILFEYRRYHDKAIDRVHTGLVGSGTGPTPPFLHLKLWRALWDVAGDPRLSHQAGRRARAALLRWLPTGDFRDLFFSDLKVELQRAIQEGPRWRAAPAAAGMVAVRPIRALRGLSRVQQLSPPAGLRRR
jgi:glycosyltransferase involved in cell wall biosynthesis